MRRTPTGCFDRGVGLGTAQAGSIELDPVLWTLKTGSGSNNSVASAISRRELDTSQANSSSSIQLLDTVLGLQDNFRLA